MKIKYFPLQAHCFAFGGFELQMLSAHNAINKQATSDMIVELIDSWSRDQDFEIAHFWGLDLANFNNIYWAKKSKKFVVMTCLLGYEESFLTKVKNKISNYIGVGKLVTKMLENIDALVVINYEQKEKAINYFGVNESKVFVIPNIVDRAFFNYKNQDWVKPFDSYIVTTGNICKRKNQLNLIKACVKTNTNLILVGEVLTGEDDYGDLVKKEISNSKNIKWIKGLPQNDEELVNLVANSNCFALVSSEENQPIGLLEAAVCQIPLIISDKPYAQQVYYKNSYKIKEDDVDQIASAINEVLNNPQQYVTDLSILEACKETSVAQAYINIYQKLTAI